VIILMHAKWRGHLTMMALEKWRHEARIPDNTPVLFMIDLPEQDAEGNPIFAFKVSGGETHYWTGEPIRYSELPKLP
jgi:hypothetical protein